MKVKTTITMTDLDHKLFWEKEKDWRHANELDTCNKICFETRNKPHSEVIPYKSVFTVEFLLTLAIP